jgi:colicin import membrane protein
MGFFDLAIAAPSMKAALEAWGSNSNLFHQGFATEADDPRIIAATMKKPGVILRRPVGSHEPFQEHADVPTDLPSTAPRRKPEKSRRTAKKKTAPRKIDDHTARKAAVAFEKKQRQREIQRRRQEAAEAKKREHRQRKVATAEAAFEEARKEHDAKVSAIEGERAKLEQRADQEETRWEKVSKRLQTAVHRARG